MNLGRLVLAIGCMARSARGDVPAIEGHVALGVRASSTSNVPGDLVADETSSVRAATELMVGLRLGPAVVGLHAGIATPLRFDASQQANSGEQVPWTRSTIYPFDLGLGAQLEVGAGFWLSAWLGASVSLNRATSAATHVSAIDFTGDIPAASWTAHTTSLGYGLALGYDLASNEHGHLAALVTIDSEGIAEIPLRYGDGQTGSDPVDLTCRSITLGMAYRY